MKFLIAGGAGSVGQALTAFFIQKGHDVRVLDKEADRLRSKGPKHLELVKGGIEDPAVVKEAVRIDVIIHLAWSFSDNPIELWKVI
jgi:UDP-glucose 4-epimerase